MTQRKGKREMYRAQLLDRGFPFDPESTAAWRGLVGQIVLEVEAKRGLRASIREEHLIRDGLRLVDYRSRTKVRAYLDKRIVSAARALSREGLLERYQTESYSRYRAVESTRERLRDVARVPGRATESNVDSSANTVAEAQANDSADQRNGTPELKSQESLHGEALELLGLSTAHRGDVGKISAGEGPGSQDVVEGSEGLVRPSKTDLLRELFGAEDLTPEPPPTEASGNGVDLNTSADHSMAEASRLESRPPMHGLSAAGSRAVMNWVAAALERVEWGVGEHSRSGVDTFTGRRLQLSTTVDGRVLVEVALKSAEASELLAWNKRQCPGIVIAIGDDGEYSARLCSSGAADAAAEQLVLQVRLLNAAIGLL